MAKTVLSVPFEGVAETTNFDSVVSVTVFQNHPARVSIERRNVSFDFTDEQLRSAAAILEADENVLSFALAMRKNYPAYLEKTADSLLQAADMIK